MSKMPTRHVLAAVALVVAAGPAMAQYDKDGRYVPSPMGVPADPYARPVPMYPGSPGGAVGTPITPRGAYPVTPSAPPRRDAPRTPPLREPIREPWISLTVDQCRQSWSKATRLTPTQFKRRCALLLKKEQQENEQRDKERALKKSDPRDTD